MVNLVTRYIFVDRILYSKILIGLDVIKMAVNGLALGNSSYL